MKKIYFKLFLACLPVILLCAIYLINDPFQVLYAHDSYFPKDGVQYVGVNKDYTSTENLIRKYPQYHYDSYIFGSSRSMYYHTAEWSKHIGSEQCYHFDAYAESLYGIERKFQFLYDRGIKINNALIILDMEACEVVADKNYSKKKHPKLTGQNPIAFQLRCMQKYFEATFLSQYITFLVTRKVESGMYNTLLNEISTHYDEITNELTYPVLENAIASNRDSFYAARQKIFYKQSEKEVIRRETLGPKQIELFKNIKRILDLNNTSYRIVISPLYNQIKANPKDIQKLYDIFDKKYVYDFSGKNEITSNKYNYYESSHYRPAVANIVMDSIYKSAGK